MNLKERYRRHVWRMHHRCRIDTEWGGLFIGRKWCATHGEYWDNNGPCPKQEVLPWYEEGGKTA